MFHNPNAGLSDGGIGYMNQNLNKNCHRCGKPYLGTTDGLCQKCVVELAVIAEEEEKKEAHKRKLFERMHK